MDTEIVARAVMEEQEAKWLAWALVCTPDQAQPNESDPFYEQWIAEGAPSCEWGLALSGDRAYMRDGWLNDEPGYSESVYPFWW
jgi:hypothetical protein